MRRTLINVNSLKSDNKMGKKSKEEKRWKMKERKEDQLGERKTTKRKKTRLSLSLFLSFSSLSSSLLFSSLSVYLVTFVSSLFLFVRFSGGLFCLIREEKKKKNDNSYLHQYEHFLFIELLD